MTEQQIAKLVASFVEHQSAFAEMSTSDAQWAIQNTRSAISLFTQAIQNRQNEHEFAIVKSAFPSDAIAKKYGYTVLEDVEPSWFEGNTLEAVSFVKKVINCSRELRACSIKLKANLGLADAKYLVDHQEIIPVKLRCHLLLFSGTLLRDSDGCLCIAGLCWRGDRWCLDFGWLDFDWDVDCRLVRYK